MGVFDLSSTVIQGAIREFRLLAMISLSRALGESANFPLEMHNLTRVLTLVSHVPRNVVRRSNRVNETMPFSEFEPNSPLQQRVLATGKRPEILERLLTRFHREGAHVPPEWVPATITTALTAPTFLAEAQQLMYLSLRRRIFFAPGGPPLEPLSVATFLTLIVRSGRPIGLSELAWARLVSLARQVPDQPGYPGPTDRLVLAEAVKTLGQAAADAIER